MANEVMLPDIGVSFADPRVAVTRPDTTTAQTIQQTGDLLGQAVVGVQQARTRNAIENVGDVLNVAHGVTAAGGSFDPETGDIVLPNPQDEQQAANFAQLEQQAADVKRRSTEAFGKINRMIQQSGGSLQSGSAMARALVEREMRNISSLTPGFEREIRQTAADVLGFDPTGGTLQALFTYTDPTAKKQQTIWDTEVGKAALNYQATALGQGIQLTQQEALRLASDDFLKAQKLEQSQQRLQFGEATSAEVLNEIYAENQLTMQGFMKNHVAKVSEMGLSGWEAGVADAALSQWVQDRVNYSVQTVRANGGTVSPTQIEQLTQAYEAQAAPYRTLIQEGVLEKMSQNQLNTLKNLAAIQGAQYSPEIFISVNGFGEAITNTFLEAQASVTNPGQLSLLVSHFPKVSALFSDGMGGLDTGKAANYTQRAFMQVLGEDRNPDGTFKPITGDPETDAELRKVAVQAASSNTKKEDYPEWFEQLGNSSPKMAISDVANNPNRYYHLQDQGRTKFKGMVARNWMELIDNVATDLSVNPNKDITISGDKFLMTRTRTSPTGGQVREAVPISGLDMGVLNTVYRKIFTNLGKELTGGRINSDSQFVELTTSLIKERRLQIQRDNLLREKADTLSFGTNEEGNPVDAQGNVVDVTDLDNRIATTEDQLDLLRRQTMDIKRSMGLPISGK